MKFINSVEDPELIGTEQFKIPSFDVQSISILCEVAKNTFQKMPNFVKISSPICVIGDLHGNYHDLIRIIKQCGDPSRTKYVFLGDYVDRGEYSIEVIATLFVLATCNPHNVTLLRGNHEFRAINSKYGFQVECDRYYPNSEVFEAFNNAFDYLPLAALIDNHTICVHGGLPRSSLYFEDLEAIKKPIKTYDEPGQRLLISDLLWSDPDPKQDFYAESTRGYGVLFGEGILTLFLQRYRFARLLRAHQSIDEGIRDCFNGRVITVFSSSGYQNHPRSICGVLRIRGKNDINRIFLPNINRRHKYQAYFDKLTTQPDREELHSFHLVSCATNLVVQTKRTKPLLPLLRASTCSQPTRQRSSTVRMPSKVAFHVSGKTLTKISNSTSV